MNKVVLPLIVTAVALVSGCASEGYREVSLETARANIKIATFKAQAQQKPLFVADIPMPDGQIAHFELAQPSMGGKNDYLRAPEDPMMRVLDRGMGVLGTAAGIYLGGKAAEGLVEATSKGIAGSLSQMPDPVIVQPPAYNQPVIVQPPAYNDPVIVQPPETVIVKQPPYNDPIIVQPPETVIVKQPAYNDPIVVQQPAYNDPIVVQQPAYNDPIIVQQPAYNDPIIVAPSDPIFVDQPVIIEPTVITN